MATRKDSAAELAAILGRLSEARAVIETACRAMEAKDSPDEVVTLRCGLKLLDAVYNELDFAA